MSPPSQGYESTRMVPECHSTSQTSQHSRYNRLFSTQNNRITPSLFYPTRKTQENGPPSLPCSPSDYPCPSNALVHLVKNLHAETLRIRRCEKIEQIPNHIRHAGLNSWLEYTNSLYIQQNHGFSPTIRFPFPIQNMNEERRVGEIQSGGTEY
jgi:hypothetical protein